MRPLYIRQWARMLTVGLHAGVQLVQWTPFSLLDKSSTDPFYFLTIYSKVSFCQITTDSMDPFLIFQNKLKVAPLFSYDRSNGPHSVFLQQIQWTPSCFLTTHSMDPILFSCNRSNRPHSVFLKVSRYLSKVIYHFGYLEEYFK